MNWRFFHAASEGLFPQLVVIPLHRDHGVITMAAGPNDVIKIVVNGTSEVTYLDTSDPKTTTVVAKFQGT